MTSIHENNLDNASHLHQLHGFLRSNFLTSHSPEIVFISGSVAEGLSTPSSDYDVYAIYKECHEQEVLLNGFDRPIEVTSLSSSKLLQIFDKVTRGEDLSAISPYELLLCHRVHTGICLEGADSFQYLKNQLTKKTLQARLSELCLMYTERSLQVSVGLLKVDDHSSAAVNAHHAVKQALNRLIVLEGGTSLLEKWQIVYGRTLLGSEHPALREFMELTSNIPLSDEPSVSKYLARAFRFHQTICDYAYLSPGKLQAFDWSSRLAISATVQDMMILEKSPMHRLIKRDGDLYLMQVSTPVLQLPEEAAKLWALIDNSMSVTTILENSASTINIPSALALQYLTAMGSVGAFMVRQFDFSHYQGLTC
ncbi:nucleotidyltransferase domain-containing protein [Pseudomonas japonica]|uniref:nucleotidyltransferase domain-containing protein n=1 Tax=Pseudomonas japonica TaxID=256466 RepID=UPI0015E45F32|nr:nucleotidyltransferase domain-containing protein [Pseudomonas japonica]MBA1244865.1 nucleotidyltransferase domain-containing protein [Pseudomonas japonica]